MDFYSILISILRRFPPGKWVPLSQTVEVGSKNAYFFTGIQWPLLDVLLINTVIISGNTLSEYVVFFREGWDEFTNAHPSIQVSDFLYPYYVSEKV